MPKNWRFLTVLLEKTLQSPLDIKEIKPVNPKENQPWVFTGRTDAEAETPILWSCDMKTDSLKKTLMLGKTEGRAWRGRQRMRWLDGITDRWTWVWANSGSCWWTGKPSVLQSMGLQRVRHSWATELKIIRLVRRFLLRRNLSLSNIHYCYIIISTELKEKHAI